MKHIILGYIYCWYGSFWLMLWNGPVARWFMDGKRGLLYSVSEWILSQAGYCRHPYYEIDVCGWRAKAHQEPTSDVAKEE